MQEGDKEAGQLLGVKPGPSGRSGGPAGTPREVELERMLGNSHRRRKLIMAYDEMMEQSVPHPPRQEQSALLVTQPS